MPADHSQRRLRFGVLGLGMAGGIMVPVIANHPCAILQGAADPSEDLRRRIEGDRKIVTNATAEALVQRDDIDAIYVATPHQLHKEHTALAARHGKHIIVEKPMALSLADCDAMIEVARANGVQMVVGHTHGFDPGVRLMRETVLNGSLGRLLMISMWNFTDFLYRPRRPEELDSSKGGGIMYNQLPHQIDIARTIAADEVRSVRAIAGIGDPARPTEGHCTGLIEFQKGVAASMVYSGYDHFDSDELHDWVGATGRRKTPRNGATRQALAALGGAESERKHRESYYGYGGGFLSSQPSNPPHFGLIVASFADGDIRVTPDGVTVYGEDGARFTSFPGGIDARGDVITELCQAVESGSPAVHDGVFAKGTVETCLAMVTSARERREIMV